MKSTSTGSAMARHEVAHEQHGALEHRHQQGRLVRVVGRDLGAELGHPFASSLGRRRPGRARRRVRPTRGTARSGRSRRVTGVTLPDAAGRPPGAARRVRRTRAPPASSVADRGARGDGEDAVHLGQRRRVVRRRSRRAATRAGRAGPAGATPRATARASAGSAIASAASDSSSATSSRSTPAWRASRGTGSRPATAAQSGSSSWRTRLRTKAGSALLRVAHRDQPDRGAQRVRSRCGAGRAAGGGGPAPCRPGRPSPAPRSRFEDGLGLVVHGVAGRHLRRAAPRSGPPGPAPRGWAPGRPTPARRSKCAPRRAAAAATTPASASEPGRRPWSTWMAVTTHPAAAARTSRARESAPPDTAQASGAPGGGNVQRAEQVSGDGRGGGCGRLPAQPTGPGHPGSRGRGSPRAWAASRGPPTPGPAARGRPASSTDSTKRSPSAYWRILASSPSSFDISLARPRAWVRRWCSTREKCAAPGTSPAPARSIVTSPWPSSRLIIPEILDSARRCSGVASIPTTPASRAGLRPLRSSVATRAQHLGEAGRVPRQRAEHLGDQADEVVPQPGDGGELQPVGHLVQRQPEPELARCEAVLLLDGDDVGPHVGHQVLVLGRLVVDQQVVLAQHPRRHVGQHQPELGPGHGAADHERGAAELGTPLRLELQQRGPDEPLNGAHVGRGPPRPVGDLGPGRPVRRAQAGRLAHEGLGARRQLVELGLEVRGPVGGGRRLEDQGAGRHALGQGPVHHGRAGQRQVRDRRRDVSARRGAGGFLRRWPRRRDG